MLLGWRPTILRGSRSGKRAERQPRERDRGVQVELHGHLRHGEHQWPKMATGPRLGLGGIEVHRPRRSLTLQRNMPPNPQAPVSNPRPWGHQADRQTRSTGGVGWGERSPDNNQPLRNLLTQLPSRFRSRAASAAGAGSGGADLRRGRSRPEDQRREYRAGIRMVEYVEMLSATTESISMNQP